MINKPTFKYYLLCENIYLENNRSRFEHSVLKNIAHLWSNQMIWSNSVCLYRSSFKNIDFLILIWRWSKWHQQSTQSHLALVRLFICGLYVIDNILIFIFGWSIHASIIICAWNYLFNKINFKIFIFIKLLYNLICCWV